EACEVLVNGYGPTENTTFTACHRMTEANQICETVSIGRPISNTQIYILDSGMKPVPVGVVGELYTGGDGLARGYLRRPALTAERFVPNPFSQEAGERLYRTGDLARYMEDGRIEFVGRADEQVKVRGFRIEPGEVETALVQCEGVRESVVVVREDARGEKLLVAYVVAESPEQPPKSGELRAALRERLPDYMIPTTYVVLDQLPLTPNGKVDRRALPALDGSRPELESRYEKPRTNLEKLLAEMWQDVLEVEAVGIQDDFFELGGTSLRVVVFVNKLEQRLNVHVPVKALFGAPNIAALAEYLKEHHAQTVSAASREDGSWSPLVEIQPGTNKPPLFFVHPVGGNVFCYFNLARRLGTDQPFYALQSIGLNNGHPGHTRIEDMVSYYIEHLRAVQPAGPYHLGGWSLGGVVAFEMARQLKADGADVSLLALIDSPSPSAFSRMPREDDLSRLASFAIDLGFTQEHVSRSFNDVRSLPLEDQLAYMLDRALAENLIPAGMELDHLQRLFRVFKTNREALRAYVPGVYAGQITYVQAVDNNANQTPNDWNEFARDGVEVHQLPGDHYSILKDPYVNALAQCIEQRIRNPATEPPDNENNLVHF
ncbi:MAG TPA: alpha/beta fold hydrolase, partial [Pyrinomonadaceae bacterium]|nr:alpha/beta fold hydrolase [Pyrinomonadaceae bacterium]